MVTKNKSSNHKCSKQIIKSSKQIRFQEKNIPRKNSLKNGRMFVSRKRRKTETSKQKKT